MLAKALASATAAAQKTYIEDVFSTWLYTGNGSTQTITNGIDLSGKGGLVWAKLRGLLNGFTQTSHVLVDTANGAGNYLQSNTTNAIQNDANTISQFNSNGFNVGSSNQVNQTSATTVHNYASWTFRKAAKFFDVVTFTANSSGGGTFSHSLGVTPGMVIMKATGATENWLVWHRSLSANGLLVLNLTNGEFNLGTPFFTTLNTTTATVASGMLPAGVNAPDKTYVAYLFAHDAGGFGDSGNESVVKCGSFTGTGPVGGEFESLSWEPQWLLIKRVDSTSDWEIYDSMRGFVNSGQINTANDARLRANLSNAEDSSYLGWPTATGFQYDRSGTYIYIAIRRGPMKTPTDATKVFEAKKNITSSSPFSLTGPPYVDFIIDKRNELAGDPTAETRLLGATRLFTNLTNSESAGSANWGGATGTQNITPYNTGDNHVAYLFRRAPGFFDVVAYAGTGVARTVSHNLGVTPELMIVKSRSSSAYAWSIYSSSTGNGYWLTFDTFGANVNSGFWNDTSPTSSVFTVGTVTYVNASGGTYVAYLFASCPGVSKVGSYTGTGTTQQINCGFTNGARFVLIKRTDFMGGGSSWFVWDSARGIVSGNDPYLTLESTAAEVTNTDYIDPLNSGFEISSTAPAAINANGGSFIYLAIA